MDDERIEVINAIDDMLSAIQSFVKATYHLDGAWCNAYLPYDVDTFASDLYPFELSFDEQASEIYQWAVEMETQLKQLRKEI